MAEISILLKKETIFAYGECGKGDLTPRQQLTTCCLQHFLVMLPVITKKYCW
jgi:hypothetical protein